MPHRQRQRLIKLSLIVFCCIFVAVTRMETSTKSEAYENTEVIDCSFPPPWTIPPQFSWPQFTSVTVRIDDAWTPTTAQNVIDNSYFVYLGTHETGHTFGLGECLFGNHCQNTAGHSIMGMFLVL